MKPRLTDSDKSNLFWFFLIPSLIILTLLISLSPWLFELLATPPGRVFTGINRWSTDYFLYLGYVEQGVRGKLLAKLLLTTAPHPALPFYLSYTLPGYIFGHILGLNSVFIYHLFRTVYGLIFLITTVIFFYQLSKSRTITVIAFLLTFYVGGFVKVTSLIPFQAVRYLNWLQEQNIIGRATGPLHYNTGFIVFIAAVLYFFYSKATLVKKILIFALLLHLLLLTNPFNYLIISICFAVYSLINIIFCGWLRWKGFHERAIRLLNENNNINQRLTYTAKHSILTASDEHSWKGNLGQAPQFNNQLVIIFLSFLFSLPLFLYLNYHLSTPIWGTTGVSRKYFVVTTPPIGFWEAAMSIGPIFFLGIAGMILCIIKLQMTNYKLQKKSKIQTSIEQSNNRAIEQLNNRTIEQLNNRTASNTAEAIYQYSNITIFLVIWPLIQFFLLLFGNQLKIHPPRAFAGLYYLPLAYFSAVLIVNFVIKLSGWLRWKVNQRHLPQLFLVVIILFLLFLITFPNYVLSYKEQLYAFTDFKNFSLFTYPTTKQVEAYKFLEKNSLPLSGVLSMFEVSNHLAGFSGNTTAMGLDNSLKTAFYSGQLTADQAVEFLKKNNFQYVYYGYQEATGADLKQYPFLKKIFENPEVKIYQVATN